MTSTALAQDDEVIAARYAPVIYQEFSIYTNDKDDPDHAYDTLRRVDYDGDWNTFNNLDHHGAEGVDDRGYVYYDVKSTATHHYVTYTFYYTARTGLFMRRNENDLMGCIVVARRNAPRGKEVELLLVRGRRSMKVVRQEGDVSPERSRYKVSDGSRRRIGDLLAHMQFDDPKIDPERTHPRIFMNAWNHKPQILNPERQRQNQLRFPYTTGRGLAYHYSPTVEHVAPKPGDSIVRYELLPQSDFDQVGSTSDHGTRLGSDQTMWGLKGPLLPHAWPVAKGIADGAMAVDPAGTVSRLFDVRRPFSTVYDDNGAHRFNTEGMAKLLGKK
jgi:hypothetical protein